ncbi:transglycosylase SLT domain-containing protein [Streptosporangium sp. KLBMP 9127]|nr:transglycosylase SLT domain-containing protein [Streptosporangium sp. KLBMP 9127]
MSASDEASDDSVTIGALPGGSDLLAVLEKVSGEPETIRGIATRWRTTAGSAVEHLGYVGASVRGVDTAWNGASADAFVTYMGKYGKASDALSGALADCATSLETAAGALETAKTAIRGICVTLISAADGHRNANPGATEEELRPGLANLVKDAVGQAKEHLPAVELAVSNAQTAIAKRVGEMPQRFSAIPIAGDQSFLPGSGKPFEWIPVPPAEGGTAAPPTNGGGANGGGAGYGSSGPPPTGGVRAPDDQVAAWIAEAIKILEAKGYSADDMDPDDIWLAIRHESNGNPNAINNWDSNAEAGIPSKGLMQTIDPTFNRWALPGHGDIYNPVDNILAGVRYAIDRYGSVSNIPGVVGYKNGTGYVGY